MKGFILCGLIEFFGSSRSRENESQNRHERGWVEKDFFSDLFFRYKKE